MQQKSPQELAFRRHLLNQSITFIGALSVLHSSLEIILNAPSKTMSYVQFCAGLMYLMVPYLKHKWFTSERIVFLLIFTGMPYLCVRIWTLNGIAGSTMAWFVIFILYAVFFLNKNTQRIVTVCVFVCYLVLLYFSYYYPPHNYADYPFELSALLSAYILGALLFHMYLTSEAYDFFNKAYTKVSLRAIHSQRLIETGRIAGQIAHEVSSPLNALSFINETIFQKLPETEQKKLHDEFEQHGMVISRISKNLQAILRSVHKSTEAKVEPINAENIMSDLNVLLSCRLKQENVQLMCDMSGIRWGSKFMVDVSSLMQVLVILANNSLDALSGYAGVNQYKIIRLQFRETDELFEILFYDSGPGISSANIPKLFTEGFTTKNTDKGMGNGLGLCIARELLWQMQGDIQYVPQAEGCTFHIAIKRQLN